MPFEFKDQFDNQKPIDKNKKISQDDVHENEGTKGRRDAKDRR